jgi:hypothetical protein
MIGEEDDVRVKGEASHRWRKPFAFYSFCATE